MRVMISYDIVNDRTRTKVMKFLKDYGFRVQLSVFECDLDKERMKIVKSGVERLINKRKDRVRYYVICEGCREKTVVSGFGEVREDEGFEII